MIAHFYDIESLHNVFTLCNYKPEKNLIDVYYLIDDNAKTIGFNPTEQGMELARYVQKVNKNFHGGISLYDLTDEISSLHLAQTFGLSDAYSVNDPTAKSTFADELRPVCDTDENYDDDKHPYLMGYNSYNYDTTMLALYLSETFVPRQVTHCSVNPSQQKTLASVPSSNVTIMPPTARQMRAYNDELFSPQFKGNMPSRLAYSRNYTDSKNPRAFDGPNYSSIPYKIRKNMLMTGRHLDVARLNEKQQKVALKRLLGMLGYQILESDKLKGPSAKINDLSEFFDLIAYNASDVINLKQLFEHKVYQSAFTLKKGLLESYPELIYERQKKRPDGTHPYKPDINPKAVRRDRLCIDSSSAQFATKSLCPYGHLTDIPVVSFLYPSENIAKQKNIPRVNVLDQTRDFFYKNFTQPELRKQFDSIYFYYKDNIEGKNFNSSSNYETDYSGTKEYAKPHSMSEIPKQNMNLFYFNKDGTPSSCFVTFSTGGIHGAEYNKKLYDYDVQLYNAEVALQDKCKEIFPDPCELKKAKTVTIDGTEYSWKQFLKSNSTGKKASYKIIKPVELFKEDKNGAYKINKKYVFTSSDPTNHEDFTSYYPNLLRQMEAFYNPGLGYDRYGEVFDQKSKYGKLMKDPSIPEDKRKYYDILRNGTKLILNSASGAGDATFESNIVMNNQIISMRIIGQLFSYTIGQAQTLYGAKITSTNTDGLYSVLEETLNNQILEKESANIGVEIEPEPCWLISKDSNNRVEIVMTKDEKSHIGYTFGKIISASGGTLSCRKGPTPTQSLAHPAIIDWALTEYLIHCAKQNALHKPFDYDIGKNILMRAITEFDDVTYLNMFQNMVSSSDGSITYIFGETDDNDEPIILQHYNRVFIMKDKTPQTMHLKAAAARKITPATLAKRKKDGNVRLQQNDPRASKILEENGVSVRDIDSRQETVIQKINSLDENWYMFICNRNLYELSDDEKRFITDNLDIEKYLSLLQNSFEENWRNILPADDNVAVA